MTASGFQVLARSPRDAGVSSKVLGDLEQRFKIDLALQLELFETQGVCVSRAASMEQARGIADVVRNIGANAVILDAAGVELEVREVELSFLSPEEAGPAGSGSLEVAPAKAERDAMDSTMFGGFHQPNAPVSPAPTPPPPAAPVSAEDPDGLSIGFGATGMKPPGGGEGVALDDASSPSHTTTPAELVPPHVAALSVAAPSPASAAKGARVQHQGEAPASPDKPLAKLSSLDNLDADNLVMLDGSEEEDFSPDELSLEQPVSADAEVFAPPSMDEDLELDDTALGHHQQGVEASADDVIPPAPAPAAPPAPEAQEAQVPQVPQVAATPEVIPAVEEPEEVLPPEPPPSSESARIAKEARAPARRARSQQKRSPLDLISTLFEGRPRIRILVGFSLALALGAIVPTCYASSVNDQFHPLLVDLSTAKAHGHLLRASPSYRSPAEIEAQISSMQTRFSIYAFLLWAIFGGAIGFVFFRFTRD